MKKTLRFIIILLIIMVLFGISNKVKALSTSLTPNKTEVNVGDTITITATITAAQWDLKITLNGKTLATSSELDNYESNITKTITATYQATEEGNLTFLLEGDATDVSQAVEKINKSVTVNVKKVETPEPEPEPETPTISEEPEFTTTNETVYATGTVNVRESYSQSSNRLGQLKQGDSIKRIGISTTIGWSKVEYNGKVAYIISSSLTTTRPQEEPVEETPSEEEPEEEPTSEPTTTQTNESDEIIEGLKNLEIEGITLSPTFSPDIYEYRAIVKEDISKLTINASTASEGATTTIAGNENLQEGENLITIIVYNANNEVEATYQITINKNTLDLVDTDQMLQEGTKAATRNLIIFIVLLIVAIIALIVVIILKHRNEYYEEDYEEDNIEGYEQDKYQSEELTNSEEIVENTDNETEPKDETTKREKRKGKHF